MRNVLTAAAGCILVAAGLLSCAASRADAGGKAGSFNYYVLSVSWSPTYCQSDAGRNDRQQCGSGRQFAFVVHGLWPQYERGWPDYCRTRENWVGNRTIESMLDIMPSKRLIIHEWKKHGTCSGLGQRGYFDLTRELFAKIRIPARYITPTRHVVTTPRQLARDFLKTNRWLREDQISVQCGNRRDRANLREIRFCFSRRGEPTACGHNERRTCRADKLVMPPVR